jgi:hypothetical protein
MGRLSGAVGPHPSASAQERAEWAEEFIYGTIVALIAMAGFDTSNGHPVAAGAIIVVGAAATWVAHAYASVLGHRLAHAGRVTLDEIVRALRGAWPIMVAAIPATIAAAGASVGWWSLQSAIRVADLVGILVLGGAGFAAARVTQASPVGIVGWVLATAGLGVAIILVELAVH